MSEAVVVALISAGSGIIAGVVGKVGVDRARTRNGNGGNGVEHAIARRDEVKFQTRMTMLMEQLTAAIEKGHDKSVQQMEVVGAAINQAAQAIREVHTEIVAHREEAQPAVEAAFETHRLVKELHKRRVG